MPKPSRPVFAASRVLASKEESTSSSSIGGSESTPPLPRRTVEPGAKVSLSLPGTTSTYFRPSAERGRTTNEVSLASGSTVLSSLRSTTATLSWSSVLPLVLIRVAPICSTAPTRKPPTRTSLPLTSFAPLGSWTFRS